MNVALLPPTFALRVFPASPYLSGWAEGLLCALLLGAAGAPLLWRFVIGRARKAAEQRSAELLEIAPDAIVGIGDDGCIMLANRHALDMFGYAKEELLHQPFDALLPERFKGARLWQRSGDRATAVDAVTLAGCRKDGAELPVDIAFSRMTRGGRAMTLAFVRDVSRQRAMLDELTVAHHRIEAELDERQQFRGMVELLQTLQSRDELRSVLSLHMARLFPQTNGAVFLYSPSRDDVETLVGWGDRLVDTDRFLTSDCWALRLGKPYGSDAAGGVHPCPHLGDDRSGYWCMPLVADAETLGVLHVRADGHAAPEPLTPPSLTEAQRQRVINVAERLALPLANFRLRESLRNQSIRDGLTGVFNRRYMEESLARELARSARDRGPLSVVMLDLDHFKQINDTFGHAVGDALLSAFGRFLATHTRADDIVCRYGGEEFALILPGLTAAAAVGRVNNLKDDWSLVTVDNRSGGRAAVTFSGGVSAFPSDGATGDALVRMADTALYRAKSDGRNRVATSAVAPVVALAGR